MYDEGIESGDWGLSGDGRGGEGKGVWHPSSSFSPLLLLLQLVSVALDIRLR